MAPVASVLAQAARQVLMYYRGFSTSNNGECNGEQPAKRE